MAQARIGIDRVDVGNQFLLGDKDCLYEDIMDAIEDSASPGILYSKWVDFGRRLNTPDDTMTTLEMNIGRPGNTYRNAISTILKESNGKPLSVVISALRNCNANDIAGWIVGNQFFLGDKDCPYEDFMDAIEDSASPGILYSKWVDFGRRLNTPDDTMTTLEMNIGRPGNTYRNAILTILKESNGKPLSDVISALRKCNANDIADAVTAKFSLR